MSISEQQLVTWSNAGPDATAQQTHATIRLALEVIQRRAGGRPVEIYLQGSYRNKTNIYGDSDVDIVCELPGVYEYDLSRLSQVEANDVFRSMTGAVYTFADFRRAVLEGSARTIRNGCDLAEQVHPGRRR